MWWKKKKKKTKRKGLRPLPSWGIETLQGLNRRRQPHAHAKGRVDTSRQKQLSDDIDSSGFVSEGFPDRRSVRRSYTRAANSEINDGQFILGKQCRYCGALVRADASKCMNCGRSFD